MHRLLVTTLLIASVVWGQPQPTSNNPSPGSISGVIREEGTGAPMTDVQVNAYNGPTKNIESITDSQGHYSLRGLDSGSYRIYAAAPIDGQRGFGPNAFRYIALGAGQDLTAVDFQIRTYGTISGTVLDQNKEPVIGLSVILIAREYTLGALRYVYAGLAVTDDQGQYRMRRVPPGRAYLLMAEKRGLKLNPVSDAPADPELRRHVYLPVYYPGSNSIDGAQPITLKGGEHRESVDLRITRTPSYCIEGKVQATGTLRFELTSQRPTSGASANGAMFLGSPGGMVGPDGKLRICDLHPGDYQITITERGEGFNGKLAFFGTASVSIGDKDVTGLNIGALPPTSLPGEVLWAGTPPNDPVTTKLTINSQVLTRAGEYYLNTKSDIPGTFSLDGVVAEDYTVDLRGLTGSLYVKDISFGGVSILHEPLRPGSAAGDRTLRIALGSDAGFVNVKTTDKDGNVVPDANILVAPFSADTEGALAHMMQLGQTDQTGFWKSTALAPGKYYLLATTLKIDKSPETIGRIWRARTAAQEVEISPNQIAPITLVPKLIE